MITLLHISDLHIGDTPQGLGSFESRSAAREPTSAPSSRGHDERVADDLSKTWARIRQEYPETKIIMTGDFTRKGEGAEFGCAHRYLHSCWLINPTAYSPLKVGLRADGDQALTIPGNHDFWGGITLNPFLKKTVLEAHFWPPPWVHIIPDVHNRFELHVVGLDSCSGLQRLSPTQVFAQGAISKAHLETIEQRLDQEELRARDCNVIRIVLLHHPPDRLTPNSQRRLSAWLRRNSVSALLTGHTHKTHLPEQDSLPPFELCCGTALQAGTYNKLPGREPNKFCFHHIDLRFAHF